MMLKYYRQRRDGVNYVGEIGHPAMRECSALLDNLFDAVMFGDEVRAEELVEEHNVNDQLRRQVEVERTDNAALRRENRELLVLVRDYLDADADSNRMQERGALREQMRVLVEGSSCDDSS